MMLISLILIIFARQLEAFALEINEDPLFFEYEKCLFPISDEVVDDKELTKRYSKLIYITIQVNHSCIKRFPSHVFHCINPSCTKVFGTHNFYEGEGC